MLFGGLCVIWYDFIGYSGGGLGCSKFFPYKLVVIAFLLYAISTYKSFHRNTLIRRAGETCMEMRVEARENRGGDMPHSYLGIATIIFSLNDHLGSCQSAICSYVPSSHRHQAKPECSSESRPQAIIMLMVMCLIFFIFLQKLCIMYIGDKV